MLMAKRMLPVTVTRGSPQTIVVGDKVPGATTTLTLRAHVQPAGAQELLILPEGMRAKGAIRIYTTEPLQTAIIETQTPPDVVSYGGQNWQVQHVDTWPVGRLAHSSALAVKVEPAPVAP